MRRILLLYISKNFTSISNRFMRFPQGSFIFLIFDDFVRNYGVAHNGWDCKDDPKRLKHDHLKLNIWFLPFNLVI